MELIVVVQLYRSACSHQFVCQSSAALLIIGVMPAVRQSNVIGLSKYARILTIWIIALSGKYQGRGYYSTHWANIL